MRKDFLLEIGTEELPPKAMPKLAKALLAEIEEGLKAVNLSYEGGKWLAAPRRLAVIIEQLETQTEEQLIERRGPTVQAAFDQDRNPTKALLGFAASCGVEWEALNQIQTDKDERFYYQAVQESTKTIGMLGGIVNNAVTNLPIPKPMRWGSHDIEFIRPVHWVLMLFGKTVVNATVLGQVTDRVTYGHRFHNPEPIKIKQVGDYETTLEKMANIQVDFIKRRQDIVEQVTALATEVDGEALYDEALLDEVTAIVECPKAMLATFDEKFLHVPKEALISAMQGHQKSFPVVNYQGKLLPYFIFVANIMSNAPEQVIQGNEKVMRARLSDAAFFYETDLKKPLLDHLPELKNMIFQEKLGTLYDRAIRISKSAKAIAKQLKTDDKLVERAAKLAKCDLNTAMVYEFPELQGIMGSYYAQHEGEDPRVCEAIKEHYLPTGAGDDLPQDPTAVSVALADKLDLLLSIFSIGLKPTGDKDPFALRRAAIGIVRILLEKECDLDLKQLISVAAKQCEFSSVDIESEVYDYIWERLKYYYLDKGIEVNLFNAVLEAVPESIADFDERLTAVKTFVEMEQASSLAEANKRVKNILRKQDALTIDGEVNESLLQEDAEKALYSIIQQESKTIEPLLKKKDYQAVLENLADLQQPVDRFFADVMVMTEDKAIQKNRLLLLSKLRNLFLTVADISQL